SGFLGAQWGPRLAGSLFVIAILAALPIGVFALMITLAACAMTGRIQIGFSVLLVLAGVAVLFISAFFGLVLGITATWAVAEASSSALFGYQLNRTNHGSFGLLLDHIFAERISRSAD